MDVSKQVEHRYNLQNDDVVLGKHLWAYLNLSLTGDAKLVFQNVPTLNGFEAWRTRWSI